MNYSKKISEHVIEYDDICFQMLKEQRRLYWGGKTYSHIMQDTLLDLGCRTSLKLDDILKIHPTINITGIDN